MDSTSDGVGHDPGGPDRVRREHFSIPEGELIMMDPRELEAESAELLPGREALGRLKFSFGKTVNVTKHVANVSAHNESAALNNHSSWSVADSGAAQSINIAH
ncbi:hypothetical protein SAVERM_1108 [Streptomyces avermitilis MA-4680 = NBRC 14893]|uniref:Uncharacterized protein n=2 Tax=Streptomyces avermitilis TaxID=33903 RepID=Q82P25_STRAW|nr:hypothetical protein SAVERM_1108 [Streptomyces avermitilis MA-4680 = NBRC 14893]